MSEFLRKILGTGRPVFQETQLQAKPESNVAEDYDIQSGHAYVLLGGKPEDIKEKCGSCGGPYLGPCQPHCQFCTTSRKVFYADITNADLLSSFEKGVIEDLSLVLPGGDSAEFGYKADVDQVIAEEVEVGENFTANLVITKKFRGDNDCEIETLILVDSGSAVLGDDSSIETLITGKNVGPVEFGSDCWVGNLLKTSTLKYKADDDFSVERTQTINRANFVEAISKAVRRN